MRYPGRMSPYSVQILSDSERCREKQLYSPSPWRQFSSALRTLSNVPSFLLSSSPLPRENSLPQRMAAPPSAPASSRSRTGRLTWFSPTPFTLRAHWWVYPQNVDPAHTNCIWCWLSLCCGDCPVHCGGFTITPDLSPQDVSHPAEVLTTKMSPDITQWPLGGKSAPIWEPLVAIDSTDSLVAILFIIKYFLVLILLIFYWVPWTQKNPSGGVAHSKHIFSVSHCLTTDEIWNEPFLAFTVFQLNFYVIFF